jgi:hypothetical protein
MSYLISFIFISTQNEWKDGHNKEAGKDRMNERKKGRKIWNFIVGSFFVVLYDLKALAAAWKYFLLHQKYECVRV